MKSQSSDQKLSILRKKLRIFIFGTNTYAGKTFDIGLLWAIVLSLLVVILESVPNINERFGFELTIAEWFFTILFTLEYFTRIYISSKPKAYIFSYLGIIDLISFLPTYLSTFLVGSQYFMVIRALRLLRVFRILKLVGHTSQAKLLIQALRASRIKITVFIGAILTIVTILGTLMYVIEGPENGFKSIPLSMYWAIVTLTTVGYGDIAPQTVLGQFIASIIMILGYGVIAVPTGIVSAEMVQINQSEDKIVENKTISTPTKSCTVCETDDHIINSKYCKHCGSEL